MILTLSNVKYYQSKTLTGRSGDENKAVEVKYAYMVSPIGLCIGLNDELFVTDSERHVIYRIFNDMSMLEVYAGLGTSGFNSDGYNAMETMFNTPTSISVNPLNGDLYIADTLNDRIRIISSSSRLVSSISHTFNRPRGVYVSMNGFVYIADTLNNFIKKYEISTQKVTIIGGGGYLDGNIDNVDAKLSIFKSPKNIFVNSNGKKDTIYFTDEERVKCIDENGMYRIVDGGVAQSDLYGIHVSSTGQIYTSSLTSHFVQMKSIGSSQNQLFIGNHSNSGYEGDNQLYDSNLIKFYQPSSLVVLKGSIIVADTSNSCLRIINLQTRIVSTLSGGFINHPHGENISPTRFYSLSTTSYPFNYRDELYFIQKGLLLRKVSNGVMKTILGCERKLTYSSNIPQRTYIEINNVHHFGNGELLLLSTEYNDRLFYYNIETQYFTKILDTTLSAFTATGTSLNNSTIYTYNYFTGNTYVFQKLELKNIFPFVWSEKFSVVKNSSNGLNMLFAAKDGKLYQTYDTTPISPIIELPLSISGISGQSYRNETFLIWNAYAVYEMSLKDYSLKKICGMDTFNISGYVFNVYGYSGENILSENAAAYPTGAYQISNTNTYITSLNYISEIKNGRMSTVAGLNPLSKTLQPIAIARDSSRKVIYFLDSKSLKKYDETSGIITPMSLHYGMSILSFPVEPPVLTLTGSFLSSMALSKYDGYLYILDGCRILQMDPMTMNYKKIAGNGCGTVQSGTKAIESPFYSNSGIGLTINQTNGDLFFGTFASISKIDMKSGIITELFTTTSGIPSPDGIITNATIFGTIFNIGILGDDIYYSSSTNVKVIERRSENEYYLRTLVGNGVSGYSGDDLPALESSITTPFGIHIKKNGDIIIMDGNYIIRMYEKKSGLLRRLAGIISSVKTFNGDVKGDDLILGVISKQIEFDESTGAVHFISGRSLIRKIVPVCSGISFFNSWNNTCDCLSGYGDECQSISCNGTLSSDSNTCNGNGECTGWNVCKCKDGFEGSFCDQVKISKPQDSNNLSTTILVISIVIPIVASLLILLIISIIIIVVMISLKRRKNRNNMEIANIETNNIELSDFPSSKSFIISSSSMGSSASDTEDAFSRYSNIVKIGQGAFGQVYKVNDSKKNNQLKAIKIVRFNDLTDLNTIMKEASQLSNIKHDHILKVNDYFLTNDNLLCIDMDFYTDGDLTKFMKLECSELIVKQVIYQMCSALNYVHNELSIIHRDIQPSNIFIKSFNKERIQVVLADFGLAKKYQEMKGQSYVGTPLFMRLV